MTPEQMFLANLPLIERMTADLCSKQRVGSSDAEDFASSVKVRLIEDDYLILRKFEGKASLSTYLHVVIRRLFLDHRTHLWGKFRPSAEAKRLGDEGLLLEELLERNGLSFEESSRKVRLTFPDITDKELQTLYQKLPHRAPRPRAESDPEPAFRAAASTMRTDERVLALERGDKARNMSRAFVDSLSRLTKEEQLILRMRFGDGLKVATIAIALGLEPKRLYKTIQRLVTLLRESALKAGVSRSDISEIIEQRAEGVELPFLQSHEGRMVIVPSNILNSTAGAAARRGD
ncbi:MAG TPA: sigma-70 family RNA polymerase sigma factor [Thermoanaerobaculia bacterium]|nr:sigma-70 family RNA polymerase sigma factor [Thermoanaerobaculia bacterium]